MERDDGTVNRGALKEQIIRLKPDFDIKSMGFKNMKHFIQDMSEFTIDETKADIVLVRTV